MRQHRSRKLHFAGADLGSLTVRMLFLAHQNLNARTPCPSFPTAAAFQASDEFKAAERLSSLGAALLHLAGTMSGELADRDRRRARHRELTSHLSESRAPLATLAGACPKRCNWLLDAKQPNWDTFIVPVPGAAAAAAAAGGA